MLIQIGMLVLNYLRMLSVKNEQIFAQIIMENN